MLFRDNQQRKDFAIAFICLGEHAGDGDGAIIRRFGVDMLGPSPFGGLGVTELFTSTTSATVRDLFIPALLALAHGHAGVESWMTKNANLVDHGRAWAQAIAAGQATLNAAVPVPSTLRPHPQMPPNGVPAQITE